MKKKVMLIEDDFDTQFLYTECFKDEGYDVMSAYDGKEAMEQIASHIPNVVIMDLNFPEASPKEFIQRLRETPGGESVPVYILSGKSDIEEETQKLGAAGFLKKPFDLDPFLDLVSRA